MSRRKLSKLNLPAIIVRAYFAPELAADIKTLAKQQRLNQSQLLRKAVEQYLDEHKYPKPPIQLSG